MIAKLLQSGKYDWVVGSDEVGFGAWAGPLVVACAAVRVDFNDPLVRDSKALSEKAREEVFLRYSANQDILWGLVSVDPESIDRIGVWKSLESAHLTTIRGILRKLELKYPGAKALTVVDGMENSLLKTELPDAITIAKADRLVRAVSLASILAKVIRDRLMVQMDAKYPGYGFKQHKGYGTEKHREALNFRGICPLHRKSYAPIARMLAANVQDIDFDLV